MCCNIKYLQTSLSCERVSRDRCTIVATEGCNRSKKALAGAGVLQREGKNCIEYCISDCCSNVFGYGKGTMRVLQQKKKKLNVGHATVATA